ncbi:MAG: Rpn family recombination-promoting nuclease/putative transposase [Treponema sp.]|nr:Rpn family recombination-promoting nuclease/putative transposase [Treponema sp.]
MALYHTADNTFKRIFSNNQLFAEFIKDFIHIDLLQDIQPEDIEDLSERFLPLFQEQRDADTVKRINLKTETPLFVITILEHESKVNYRASFKMLQYISLVLDNWEKEAEREDPGSSFRKDFKYPPVLPIVFYDGKDTWTAERNFLNRTHLSDVFEKYIPKFEYELVNLNDHSVEGVMNFKDALSLLLLVDKIRKSNDPNLLPLPSDYLEALRLQIPDNLGKLINDVIRVFLAQSGIAREEVEQYLLAVEKADHKEYGGMFEAAIESILEEREEARAEGRAEGKAEGRVEGEAEGVEKQRREVLDLIASGKTLEEIQALLTGGQNNSGHNLPLQ